MTKQLVLTKKGNDYELSLKDESNRYIKIKKNTINGEDLYLQFYKHIGDSIKYEITSDLEEKQDKVILKQLKELFAKIDEQIKKTVKF